jgi:thioredoxin 1
MANILTLTDDNFTDVIHDHSPLVVDFWAPWCGPCRMVAPILDRIATDRDDITIAKLNTDDNPNAARSFGIMAIPTMIVFRDGQAVRQWQGALPEAKLREQIDMAITTTAVAV